MKKLTNKATPIRVRLYITSFILGLVILSVCAVTSMIINIHAQQLYMQEHLEDSAAELGATPCIIDSVKQKKATQDTLTLIQYMEDHLYLVDHVALLDENGNCFYYSHEDISMETFPVDVLTQLKNYEHVFLKNLKVRGQKYLTCVTSILKDRSDVPMGYAMVFVRTKKQYDAIFHFIPYLGLAVLLLIGLTAHMSSIIVKTIHKQTHGYSLEVFNDQYTDQSNIIKVMDAGIIAINLDARITQINPLAKSIMNVTEDIPYGEILMTDVFPESTLPEVLHMDHAIYNEHAVINGKHLLVTHLPLYEDGQKTGALSIFHPAKIITDMAEQLENVTDMVNTLRAFNHDFMNKLHVILGYLETDHVEEAKQYLLNNSMRSSKAISQVTKQIELPAIAALIAGKVILAFELGIDLLLTPDSFCTGFTDGITLNLYVTLLGNLLTNAIEELNAHDTELKEIQLTLYMNEDRTYISVLDTGLGISPENLPHIFDEGFSTKGNDRGSGLYILKQLLADLGSELKVDTEPGEGTEISVLIQPDRSH